MKKLALLSLILFIITMSSVQATGMDFFEITEYEEINGSLGVYIVKKTTGLVNTDPGEFNESVVNYKIDGNSVGIISNGSAKDLSTDKSKLVILNVDWPSSGYYTLELKYTDENGQTYPADEFKIFSHLGMDRISASVDVKRVLVDTPFNLTITIKNNGDSDIANIRQESYTLPEFFLVLSKSIPTRLKVGESAEIIYNFDNARENADESMIYKTVYFPFNLTYTYHGEIINKGFNESIVTYNPDKVTYLPNVNMSVFVPYALKNSTINVSVYPINSNIGGHKACNFNFTLIKNISGVDARITRILPAEELTPSSSYDVDPMVSFKLNIDKDAPVGTYPFKIHLIYKDCDWKSPQEITRNLELKVVDELPQDVDDQEEDKPEQEEEKLPQIDASIDVPEVEQPKEEDQKFDEQPEEEKEKGLLFYVGVGILATAIVFIMVYALITRGSFI